MRLRELNPNDVIIVQQNESLRWVVPGFIRGTRQLKGREGEVKAVTGPYGERAARKTYFKIPTTPKGEPVINIEIEIYAALRGHPYTLEFLGGAQRQKKRGPPVLETYLFPWCNNSLADLLFGDSDPTTKVRWFLALSSQEKWVRYCTIFLQLCHALALFHSLPEPIIHHDIKPSNILFHPDTHAIIYIDFRSGAYLRRRNHRVRRRGDGDVLGKAQGKDSAKFRNYRKENRVRVGDKWERDPKYRIVHFEDGQGDDSFAGHLNVVGAYIEHLRQPNLAGKLCDITSACLSTDPRARPSASALYSMMREAVLGELDDAAQAEFPPFRKSPENSATVLRTLPDTSDDEEASLILAPGFFGKDSRGPCGKTDMSGAPESIVLAENSLSTPLHPRQWRTLLEHAGIFARNPGDRRGQLGVLFALRTPCYSMPYHRYTPRAQIPSPHRNL
ncbi:kinase-like domain-containing protein [Fimicolochytrium jonesii]|uniref:kinase-like domain-containing protein n=1 Tax=Fimicolochytrium jonesii TaxID=1396493 RepID=UPI0022FF3BFF|nr:kinase-like domain-containing protein [Fimicolochytrium jonesii]KAI8815765.1 kinase-like domain-containing protein [Fimicolochytrium jonesii]